MIVTGSNRVGHEVAFVKADEAEGIHLMSHVSGYSNDLYLVFRLIQTKGSETEQKGIVPLVRRSEIARRLPRSATLQPQTGRSGGVSCAPRSGIDRKQLQPNLYMELQTKDLTDQPSLSVR